MKQLLSAFLVAAALALPARAAHAQSFTVVVNSANPVQSVSRDMLSKLFLKKATWASGVTAAPVDLAENSSVRDDFTKLIHKKSVPAVKAYWQQQIFGGHMVPPPEKASDDEVIAYVRATPGAIGYVSVSANTGAGVKEIGVVVQ